MAVNDQSKDAAIRNCPTPAYHATHRYCPSCPFVFEESKPKGEQKTVSPFRDKHGREIRVSDYVGVQYAKAPPGLMFSTADTVQMKLLGLSDSVTAPCGATIPTCAVADGKTICGCGHIHPPQFHSINLIALFAEVSSLRERVRRLDEQLEQPEDAPSRITRNEIAAIARSIISPYVEPVGLTGNIERACLNAGITVFGDYDEQPKDA